MIHWVTSFTQTLYVATGRDLVSSFVRTGSAGRLHVHSEGAVKSRPPGSGEYAHQVDWVDGLQNDDQLKSWLKANEDIIPTDLGGKWVGPCKCKNGSDPNERNHTMPCPGAWFCRHASRWYRKMVALRRTLDSLTDEHLLDPTTKILWVDSDVVFTAQVDEARVDSWFRGHDVFYLKGPKRKEWEVGVVGVTGAAGIKFLRTLFDRFTSGVFRENVRWDDGYQFRMASKTLPDVRTVDLATDASGHSDVVPHSPLGKVLIHNKGRHGRILKIFH